LKFGIGYNGWVGDIWMEIDRVGDTLSVVISCHPVTGDCLPDRLKSAHWVCAVPVDRQVASCHCLVTHWLTDVLALPTRWGHCRERQLHLNVRFIGQQKQTSSDTVSCKMLHWSAKNEFQMSANRIWIFCWKFERCWQFRNIRYWM